MNKKSIRVFAPATVANVACGFDIFGFALENPGDEVTVTLIEEPKISIKHISGDEGILPLDPQQNTAGVSILKYLEHLKLRQGVEIEIYKKMPLSSGLGSSAASAVGSLYGLNLLLGMPLTQQQLLPFAMEAEKMACGYAHADNVAPALLGGFVLIRSYDPLDIIQVPFHLELYCTILHPKKEIQTKLAREILKPEITLKQHVIQSGNAVGLVIGLMQGNAELMSRCLQDVITEPIRSKLIPGFYAIKQAALEEGALGCSLSGSGPSLFALSTKPSGNIGKKMVEACLKQNLECDLFISKINKSGPRILC